MGEAPVAAARTVFQAGGGGTMVPAFRAEVSTRAPAAPATLWGYHFPVMAVTTLTARAVRELVFTREGRRQARWPAQGVSLRKTEVTG